MLKADKDLVVVGDYSRGYYNTDGYEKLKQILFDKNCNKDFIDGLYIFEDDGEIFINQEVYNKLDLMDIDGDIQQVLTGNNIIEHLVDNEPDEKGNYICQVKINGGWDYVKIPSYLFEIIDN